MSQTTTAPIPSRSSAKRKRIEGVTLSVAAEPSTTPPIAPRPSAQVASPLTRDPAETLASAYEAAVRSDTPHGPQLSVEEKLARFEAMERDNARLIEANRKMAEEKVALTASQAASEARIEDLRRQAALQRRESCQPIRRPVLSKDDRPHTRLTSTQELLGLIPKEASDLKENGDLSQRGWLKETSWKYLLATSRDVITYGIQTKILDVLPDWRHLATQDRNDLIDKFNEYILEVPCIKALFHHGDRFDATDESETWEGHWPLAEMLKSTMDGIKNTDKRQKDIKKWLHEEMKEGLEPPSLEYWPVRAYHLTTAVIHRNAGPARSTTDPTGTGADVEHNEGTPEGFFVCGRGEF